MILIGERLNSSRKAVLEAFRNKDEEFLLREALSQERAGADYIDLNASALMEREVETLLWAIPLLNDALRVPLSLDTPNSLAMTAAFQVYQGRAILNSLTAEKEKLKGLLPLIREYKPRVIALCLDESGLPGGSEQALAVGLKLVDLLVKAEVQPGDIFLDPLVRPVGVDQEAVCVFLDSLGKIKENLPGVKTIAGLSNVSFGLPERRLINKTMLVLAMGRGLDAAILDPCDEEIRALLIAAQALLGQDPGLKDYLRFIREKRKAEPSNRE